uniref:Rhomboid-like protein n=1 Tax=Macrostomum lignano TaxID=282301 RepID=A0A1I8FBE2_9PLAT
RWLFVLTGAGQVGYIPFLYAAKEAWAPCRPVPSMRRYCREFSPQPAQQPAAADCPGPPAMAPEERLPASEESSDSRRGWTRPSSLRLEPSGASLPGFEARSSRAPQLQSVALDRPRRSSFDSAVSCVAPPAAAAVAAAAKRRVTFRTDAEIIGTADNIDRQPVYQQFQPAPNEFQSGRNAAEQRHSYFGHRQGDA